ncbi:hypothetical protein SUDANB145_04000 [Streptomyces sp. enrichment culture]|uniref:RNA polymerase sigma factor n=1 Tax=Streptomyces sp. enrichment culture TaxID=1795815 RepID=UPI003F575912
MKKRPLIPGQRESILPLLCPEEKLPSESRPQWGYISANEPSFRRHVLVNVGETHEGEVSDKTFQGLHTRLTSGPVEHEIKDYAWKSFGNAVKAFHRALTAQRKRELLLGDDTWALDEAPMPVPGYVPDFAAGSVEAPVAERLLLEQLMKTLGEELEPRELLALALVKVDGMTSRQASQLLGITDGAVRNAVHRARVKLKPVRGRLGLA